MKTSELTGAALNWAVAKSSNLTEHCVGGDAYIPITLACAANKYVPSTDWEQGGPIIEREKITTLCAEGDYNPSKSGTPDCYDSYWVAEMGRQDLSLSYGSQGDNYGLSFKIYGNGMQGPTPLIAAMRCLVFSRLGGEVDVPEGLV